MTRNPDVPDRWPASRPSQPGDGGQIPGLPSVPSATPKLPAAKVPPPKAKPTSRAETAGQRPKQLAAKAKNQDSQQSPAPIQKSNAPAPLAPKPGKKRFGFVTTWPFLVAMTVLVTGSMGFMAVAILLKLPSVPNCPTTFWPTASASLRLYCAQLAANKQTADNLLEAIALVNSLPSDHPLRPEINRHIEQWSLDILKLGEQEFQSGKIEQAIALARKIPKEVPAYKLVEKRIESWQSIWAEGEGVYEKAKQNLRQSNWHKAFEEAVHLTRINNNYWSQTKYEELLAQIQTGREDSAKLDKAYQLSKEGGLDNLLAAIKVAQGINANSFADKEAKDLISDCGKKLMKLAQDRLDARDWGGVIKITNKISPELNLKDVFQDYADLANAGEKAALGNVTGLEQAIAQAQRLDQTRPLRDKAQDLVARWQKEIEDVAHLQRARDLAQPGTVNDLMAAIAEAQLVPPNNPRSEEAKAQIRRWTNQVETVQDRPYLDRAEQLANMGDPVSLQDAIAQASQIARGRALYQEAQNKIAQWSNKIQRMQDQPYLDQAENLANSGNLSNAIETAGQIKSGRLLYQEAQRNIRSWRAQIERQEDQPYLDQADTLANSGNLPSAIAAAGQIKSGRSLYDKAQDKIRLWQRDIQGGQRLQEANELAKQGTPEALASAVRAAKQVPGSSSAGSNAREFRKVWSYQLLDMAQKRADSGSIQEAIAIAKSIPSGTSAYEDAQRQIQAWQQSQNPQPQTLPTN